MFFFFSSLFSFFVQANLSAADENGRYPEGLARGDRKEERLGSARCCALSAAREGRTQDSRSGEEIAVKERVYFLVMIKEAV